MKKHSLFSEIVSRARVLYLEALYQIHLRVRYGHDLLYHNNKAYKKYSDNPITSTVHKATLMAFVASFVIFTFMQYIAPDIFNLVGPEKALAASIQRVWTTIADFTNNNGATGTITNSNVNLNGGDPQLSTTTGATTENTTAQFGGHTKSNTAGGTNNVYLLKPVGATASVGSECSSGFVSGGVCINVWLTGRTGSVLDGKYVFYRDVASTDKYTNGNALGTITPTWGPYGVVCPSPYCTVAGPVAETQSGYTGKSVLVADNNVNFNPSAGATPDYPARDACKALGGRLPTIAELLEMYNYKATYGNNFQSLYYWSSTETNSNYAYIVHLLNGNINYNSKSYTNFYTRCVR